MALATLAKSGATTWTADVGNEFGTAGDVRQPAQIMNESRSGVVQVTDLGFVVRLFPIRFRNCSLTNKNDLVTFWTDSNVEYSKNSITYTDEDSNSFTARLMVGSLTMTETGPSLFTLEFLLREELS